MFRAGEFTATHVRPTDAEQVQPNGVDLRLADILTQRAPGRIEIEIKPSERASHSLPRRMYLLLTRVATS